MHGVFNAGILSSVATVDCAHLWKAFRSKPNTIPVDEQNCSPSHRNGVRLQNGMLFGFTTEWCSPSERNAVRIHNGMVFAFRTESRSPSTGFPNHLLTKPLGRTWTRKRRKNSSAETVMIFCLPPCA
jgi:hypothetical protein